MSDTVSNILQVLQKTLPPSDSLTPLHIPEFDELEETLVSECIKSNFVSSVGPFVDRFEEKLQEFTGAKRCILCVNGTSALHLALHLAGVRPGDEVLIPSFTFVATANAVTYCGAIPHFLDIEDSHLGIDPGKLLEYIENAFDLVDCGLVNRETGSKVKAIIPMHPFGHPCRMSELNEISESFHLSLIEDAAESLGSYYYGKHTGTAGLCGILSFNGNKVITTGGGGAILTNDMAFADRAKHLSTTAKSPHRWHFQHDAIGFNYRMPAINAALGCAQMEKLPNLLTSKRLLADSYQKAFDGIQGVRFLTERHDSKCNYWLNALILEDDSGKSLEELLKLTNDEGIMTRPAWTPMHMLPIFSHCPAMDMSVTEAMARSVINIPSFASLARAT